MIFNMIKSFECQKRRYEKGLPFMAKAVKKFLKRKGGNISPEGCQKLGTYCYTSPNFERASGLGENPDPPEGFVPCETSELSGQTNEDS